MNSILIITNGNIGGTAGDAALVLRRAKAIYNEKGLFTHILLYKPVKQGTVNTGDFFYDITKVESKSIIKSFISSVNPKYVILYGDRIQMMTAELSRYIKKESLRAKVILDIQGAVEEKKEYGDSFLRKRIIYPIALLNFKNAVNHANGAFVVSDELKLRCEEVNNNQEFEFLKVRCGTEKLIAFEQIKSNRIEFRKKKGITNETIVFCYSGFRAPWQKVDEIIDQCIKIDKQYTNCYFAFFCNIDDAFLDKLSESFPKGNYCAELLKPEDYFKSLCGCDVGFILRDYNETNRVAFPNKFSDYLVCGLLVALNNALPEPMRLICSYDELYIDTDNSDVSAILKKALYRHNNYNEFLEKTMRLCKDELLYDSQVRRLDM